MHQLALLLTLPLLTVASRLAATNVQQDSNRPRWGPKIPGTGTLMGAMINSTFASVVSRIDLKNTTDPYVIMPEIPDISESSPRIFPGAKRKTIRTGPFKIPWNRKEDSKSPTTVFDDQVQKPCEACVILSVSSELQRADGSAYEYNSGTYMTYNELALLGPGLPILSNPSCKKPSNSETFYRVGRGRSMVYFAHKESEIKTGVHVRQQDKLRAIAGVVHDSIYSAGSSFYVWIAYTYEYFDGEHSDYAHSKVVLFEAFPEDCMVPPFMYLAPAASKIGYTRGPPLWEANPWWSLSNATLVSVSPHTSGALPEVLEVFHKKELICSSKPSIGKVSPDEDTGGYPSSTPIEDEIFHVQVPACILPKGRTVRAMDPFRLGAGPANKDDKGWWHAPELSVSATFLIAL